MANERNFFSPHSSNFLPQNIEEPQNLQEALTCATVAAEKWLEGFVKKVIEEKERTTGRKRGRRTLEQKPTQQHIANGKRRKRECSSKRSSISKSPSLKRS